MYSNELSNKLWFLCRKIFYDSPLIGFNSLNVNTRRYYATLSNNKHKMDDIQIDPWFITGFSDGSNLSLVVWGTNLTSTVGTGRFTKQITHMINLPSYHFSVMVGLVLSDGWLTIPRPDRKNARFCFLQSLDKAYYVWFVFNILSHYCSRYPYLRKRSRLGVPSYALEFVTRILPCFTELHFLFIWSKNYSRKYLWTINSCCSSSSHYGRCFCSTSWFNYMYWLLLHIRCSTMD